MENTHKERKHVVIYTDGSALGNPGPGGYGVVISYQGHERELSSGFRLTTNNRMEILAAIVALETLTQTCKVTLHTDSQYLVNSITKGWAKRWQANGWRRNKKEKALNVDLWKRLLPLCDTHQVDFVWVRGHTGNPGNERCDALARQAAEQQGLPVDTAYEKEQAKTNPTLF